MESGKFDVILQSGQLVNYKLSDCCGNPTSLGKEVCKALFEC